MTRVATASSAKHKLDLGFEPKLPEFFINSTSDVVTNYTNQPHPSELIILINIIYITPDNVLE